MPNTELSAIATSDHRAFIRAPLAAKLLNKTLDELNGWSRKRNFSYAKATAFTAFGTTGVWFDLNEILELSKAIDIDIECDYVFRPSDPTKETH
jgi:hypothetical protein